MSPSARANQAISDHRNRGAAVEMDEDELEIMQEEGAEDVPAKATRRFGETITRQPSVVTGEMR